MASETPPLMGQIAFVLRAPAMPDCSRNGISANNNTVVVVGKGLNETFKARANMPALVLCEEDLRMGDGRTMLRLRLPDDVELGAGRFGGNFAYSSDARWPGKDSHGCSCPIKIFDRFGD